MFNLLASTLFYPGKFSHCGEYCFEKKIGQICFSSVILCKIFCLLQYFSFKKESGELVGAIYSTKKSLVCVLIICFRLEISENSPQNKITGCNQFFEGKFRQFVGKKNWFFLFGVPNSLFQEKEIAKNLMLFLKPPKITTIACKLSLGHSTFILWIAPNFAEHTYQPSPMNQHDNIT